MTKTEALQMCLEYIETDKHERKYVRHAIKAALEQPEQEPVAQITPPGPITQYRIPTQRPWVGLTDDEMSDAVAKSDG
jgi:hypothetical protein